MKKTLFFAALCCMTFATCKKDPVDPNAELLKKIETLVADSTANANAMRAAVQPALTQPDDVSWAYWLKFNGFSQPKETFIDSANLHIKTIDAWRETRGNPLPNNNETLSALYTKATVYLVTVEDLLKAREELKK